MSVMIKRLLQIALFALGAVVLCGLSMFIKTGADATESGTIGVISKWGFPIHYGSTAAGWTWTHYDARRFWMNSIAWFAVLMAVWITVASWRSHKA